MIDPEMNFELKNMANKVNNNASSLKYRLGMTDELTRFQLELIGFVKNPEYPHGEHKGQKYILIPNSRMCGEGGAIAITNYVRNAVDKVASDTKLDDKAIARMCYWFDVEFSQWVARNIRKLDIVPTHARAIVGMGVRLFELTINRSIGGWLGDGINKGLSHSEVHHIDEVPKQKKVFENFLGGGSK